MDYRAAASEAKSRLEEIERERQALLQFIESAEALAGLAPKHQTKMYRAVPAAAPKVRRRPAGAMESTRKAVADILRKNAEPMPTRDILASLVGTGVEVGGKDPVATLSARLSNSEEFEMHRGHGWWFFGEAIPEFDFEEAEDTTLEGPPSASNSAQGREAVPGGGT